MSAEAPNPLDLRSESSKPVIPNCFSIGAGRGGVNGRERLLYTSSFYVEGGCIEAVLTSIAAMPHSAGQPFLALPRRGADVSCRLCSISRNDWRTPVTW